MGPDWSTLALGGAVYKVPTHIVPTLHSDIRERQSAVMHYNMVCRRNSDSGWNFALTNAVEAKTVCLQDHLSKCLRVVDG